MANIAQKIVWRVSPAPTGPYRSFSHRGWPSADYADGRTCAYISCEDSYEPRLVREGNHAPLTLRIADYSVVGGSWQWRKAKSTFATLAEAKAALARILEVRPELQPKA
jgi:hypothetical protein